jgi:hypothetical protein
MPDGIFILNAYGPGILGSPQIVFVCGMFAGTPGLCGNVSFSFVSIVGGVTGIESGNSVTGLIGTAGGRCTGVADDGEVRGICGGCGCCGINVRAGGVAGSRGGVYGRRCPVVAISSTSNVMNKNKPRIERIDIIGCILENGV